MTRSDIVVQWRTSGEIVNTFPQEQLLQQEVEKLETDSKTIKAALFDAGLSSSDDLTQNGVRLEEARGALVAHQEKLRLDQEKRQLEEQAAWDFFVGRVLPALAIVGATICCCCNLPDVGGEPRGAGNYAERVEERPGDLLRRQAQIDPYAYVRLPTPHDHIIRRGLELRIDGGLPASKVWRLTRKDGSDHFSLMNLSTEVPINIFRRGRPFNSGWVGQQPQVRSNLTGTSRTLIVSTATQHPQRASTDIHQ